MAKCKSFVFYYNLPFPHEWDADLKELKANGINYVIPNLNLQQVMSHAEEEKRFLKFLDRMNEYGIKCVPHLGKLQGLYLDPEVRKKHLELVKRVAREIGSHPSIYAFYLEDEPRGGTQYSAAEWAPNSQEFEASIRKEETTPMGRRLAEHKWRATQYTRFVREQAQMIKEINEDIKLTICFNIPAAVPRRNFVNMQDVAKFLDFVLIDVYPGWQTEKYEHRYIIEFMTTLAKSLTNKEVWFVVGSHIILNLYEPSLDEIRLWAIQAHEKGADAIGWFSFDFVKWSDKYSSRGLPTGISSPKRWKLMMQLSRDMTVREVLHPAVEHAFLFAYDTAMSMYSHIYYIPPYATLASGGIDVSYVSDNSIIAGTVDLRHFRYLLTTPAPVVREEIKAPLLNFAKNGGTIVGSCDDFVMNEQMRESNLRRDIFGINEEETFPEEDRITLTKRVGTLPEGTQLTSYYKRIRVTRAENRTKIIGRWSDGGPAILETPIGRGRSIYVGTNLYWAALYPEPDPRWNAFLQSL